MLIDNLLFGDQTAQILKKTDLRLKHADLQHIGENDEHCYCKN